MTRCRILGRAPVDALNARNKGNGAPKICQPPRGPRKRSRVEKNAPAIAAFYQDVASGFLLSSR
jgi:hypothetical protein